MADAGGCSEWIKRRDPLAFSIMGMISIQAFSRMEEGID